MYNGENMNNYLNGRVFLFLMINHEHEVGGINPQLLMETFQGFIHPRWCRISSINSMYRNGRLFANCFSYPLFLVGLCHGKTDNPWQPEGGAYYGFHGTWFQCVQWCQQLPYLAGFEDGTTTKTWKHQGREKKTTAQLAKIRFCKRTSSLFVKKTEEGHKNIRHFFHEVTWSWM